MRAILSAVYFGFIASSVYAQDMTCDYSPALVEVLATQYGEMPLERGLNWNNQLVEWWANPETGTWSLVVLDASGVACIPAHGQMYEAVEPVALGIDG